MARYCSCSWVEMQKLLVLLSSVVVLGGCNAEALDAASDPGGAAGADGLTRSCNASFSKLDGALEACSLSEIASRVGVFRDEGSAAVVAIGSGAETLILTAAHNARRGTEETKAVPPSLSSNGEGDINWLDPRGQISLSTSAARNLYYPGIPSSETGDRAAFLSPRNDFWFVVATASPTLSAKNVPPFRIARAGESVRVVGIAGGGLGPRVTACTVLDDARAKASLKRLAAEGDEEGGIPYDPEAEALCEGRGFSGMSGGGVFGTDGAHVGVIVRASSLEGKSPILRFVRTSFAVGQLQRAASSAADRRRIEPFLTTK